MSAMSLVSGDNCRKDIDLQAIISTSLILFSVPFCKVKVGVPVAPDHVMLIGEPALTPSNEGIVNWRPVVDEAFVPAGIIVNWREVAVCPDVSSRRRT